MILVTGTPLACDDPIMVADGFTLDEIAELIKGQALISLGPWPPDLRMFVFSAGGEWSCGLSPASQISDAAYREGVLQIVQRLKKTVTLRSP